MTAPDARQAEAAVPEREVGRLRRRVAELEAENARLRQARRVAIEVEAHRAALRDSEERYRLVVESATDYAILIMDLGRRVTGWNVGAERVLGWTEAEILGQPADVIFTPEDREAGVPEQEARGAVEAGRAEDVRWHLRRDGSRLWANGVMLPLRDDAGAIRGLLKILRDKTAEKRAADELRLEREFLAALIRHAPVGISVAEAPSGRALILNDKARELIGHGEGSEDARRYERYGAVHPDGRAYAVDDYPTVRALRRGEVVEQEEMLYRRGGPEGAEITRIAVSSAPVRDAADVGHPEGRIVAAVTILIDVEQQRRAEAALRASEARLAEERARLAALVDHLPVGVCFVAPDGTPVLSNPAYRRFLPDQGLPSLMPDGEAQWIAWDERGERLLRDRYVGARALRGEAVPGIEFLYRAPDGAETWTRVSGVPLLGAGGEVAAALVVIADIDGQKRAQEALQRLNETLEARVAERTAERDRMWQLSTDLMLVARLDGTIAAVNPAWTALLGWREDELVGRSFMELIHPDDAASTLAEVDRQSQGLTTLRFENRYRHKDGGHRWLSWAAVPEAGLIHAVARDVTAEREQAEALAQAEAALRHSQRMEAVGQLTGGLAHDFNNLLAGMSGSLELLQTRVAQGRINDLERYLVAAQGAAKRAAALTHRLLAFSRRQTLDPRPTDVNRLVAGMQELIERTTGPEVTVEPVAGVGLWTTLVDPGQLENALLNLCINARDAMAQPSPGGSAGEAGARPGGRITVETANRWLDERAAGERDMLPGQYVSLCVSDNGTGMAPDVIARAFDPFFTTKPIGMGTGLGLSMVYGFARQSGGQVRIHSEVGQGTTVCLYLPRHAGEADAPEDVAELSSAPRASSGETVLVVDDEPTVRMLVTEVLEELGYTAIEAADGAAGLRVLQSDARIDLLVTDVGLPGGMNGRQVADAARVARPGLRVLFITGYAENAVLSRGHLEPGMHVLTKPFAMEALASRIKELTAG